MTVEARLASLASSKRIFSYDELMKEMNVASDIELEKLIRQSVEKDLVKVFFVDTLIRKIWN